MDYLQKIIDLFPKVVESFKENELAYLSLTSKPERPIQDQYALLLNEELTDKITIKEYKRRDLVIFNENEELATHPNDQIDHIIEFKAGSASCFTKKSQSNEYLQVAKDFVESVAKDIANRKRENTTYAETIDLSVQDVTCVFIGAEVMDPIPENFTELFQYSSRHNRHLSYKKRPNLGERMIERFSNYPKIRTVKAFRKPLHCTKEVGSFKEIRIKIHLLVVQGNPTFDFESIRD